MDCYLGSLQITNLKITKYYWYWDKHIEQYTAYDIYFETIVKVIGF